MIGKQVLRFLAGLMVALLVPSCALMDAERQKAKAEGIEMGKAQAKPRADAEFQWKIVKVPSAVRGGAVIPEHEEWVLFRGGETQGMPYLIPPKEESVTTVIEKKAALPELPAVPTEKPVAITPLAAVAMEAKNPEVITKQTIPGKTTGKGSLSALFIDAVFNGKTRNLTLDREFQYSDLSDLCSKLQAHFNIYAEVIDGILTFSDMKEVTYDTGFATEDLANNLKGLLNHGDSTAVVNKTAGTITVSDDPKGQDNIKREIRARNDQYVQYHYKIVLLQSGNPLASAEGLISAAFPAKFVDGGVNMTVRGNQILVAVAFSKYPDLLSGIISKEGGDIEGKRNDLQLRVSLSRK